MLHRLGCRARGCVANGGIPIADADDATCLGNAADFIVGQIAVDLARRLHAAMAGHDGTLGHGEDLGNARMRQMRDVDNHALGLHAPNDIAAKGRQPTLFQAVHRTCNLIIEEMREARHAEPGGIEAVEIGGLALEILQAFDRQHRAHWTAVLGAQSQQIVELRSCIHRQQGTF